MISRRRFLLATGWTAAGVTVVASLGRGLMPVLPSSGDPPAHTAMLWLQLAPHGRLTLWCPVHELGQGTSVGLAQIAAEELGLDLGDVEVRWPDSTQLPYLRMTTGSAGIAAHAHPLALAAATLRERLRSRAARQWQVDARSVRHVEAAFVAADGRRASLADLAQGEPEVLTDATDDPSAPVLYTFDAARPKRWVGLPMPTAQAEAIVRGQALFAADVRLPDMAYGRAVQAPCPGARIARLDEDAARAEPGVLAVVVDRERAFVGAVARTPAALERCLARLAVRWQTPGPLDDAALAAAVDVDAALQRGPLTHTLVQEGGAGTGPWTVDLRLDLPPLHHAQQEPRAAVARFIDRDGTPGLELWLGSQDTTVAQRKAADELGWPPERVRVHRTRVGGAFGGRALYDVAGDAMRLARAAGCPVKVLWSREDEFQADRLRPPSSHRVRLRLDATGRLQTWWHAMVSGPMLLTELLAPGWALPPLRWAMADFGVARSVVAPYTAPQRRIECDVVPLPVHTGPWRSLGATPNTFAIESAMDEAARVLGWDPIDLRLRNLGPEHERLAHCLRRLQALTGAAPIAPDMGRGVACGTYHGNSHVACAFDVQIKADRRVRIQRAWCVQDTGLVINPDQVRAQIEGNLMLAISQVLHERARLTPEGPAARRLADHPVAGFAQRIEPVIDLVDRPAEAPAGVGETALIAAVPALANAIRTARGERPLRLPWH